jgi:hypothetical protein
MQTRAGPFWIGIRHLTKIGAVSYSRIGRERSGTPRLGRPLPTHLRSGQKRGR